MKLAFLGAAGTVTGSKFLVSSPSTRVLVDCGLYQGVKQLRLRNWAHLPVSPRDLDAVALTHAHLDHSGYLPALVRDGFDGPIYCTPPTAALCDILLPDSGHIQEEDARYANRKKFSKHAPALPLYTEDDARRVSPLLRGVAPDAVQQVGDLVLRFRRAGHILGASSISVACGGSVVHFSGDLGRSDDLLMSPPEPPPEDADWVVIESTYGDRVHHRADPVEAVADVVRRTYERGGITLIPSFAVGRTQALLYCLFQAFRRGALREIPVFVNSPMATDVTGLYQRFAEYHRLSPGECAAVFGAAHYVRSVEESKELNDRRFPMVVISASGMATGGRVLHHLKALAPDHRNTILLSGFQAPGTRGDALAHGASSIKIHGGPVTVNAEVVQLDLLSAHADQGGLLDWLAAGPRRLRGVLVAHGEPVASDTLRRCIRETLGHDARVPEYREEIELDD